MKSRIYLDHAATTPVDPRVLRAMKPYFGNKFGNPGSLHSFGQEAMAAVDNAREIIARALGRDAREGFREIVFTGSATEANNLALRGIAGRASGKARIIVSSIEHESVLETAKTLEHQGMEVVYLPVDAQGRVKPAALRESLSPETILVSVMYVNNETGAIQPIREISNIVREFGSGKILLHTDAAQALGHLNCDPDDLGVDLMTISAHKIGGPKGVGVLFTRGAPILPPEITGGGQEFGFRSATENVAGITGFGEAVKLLKNEKEKTAAHIRELRELFLKELAKLAPGMRLNGPRDGSPHIANVWLPGKPADEVLIALDRLGVAISSGSACRSRSMQPSYVLRAMGLPEKRIRESLRVSFFRTTTKEEVRKAIQAFKKALSSK